MRLGTIHQIAFKQKEDEVDHIPQRRYLSLLLMDSENASNTFTTPIIKEMISMKKENMAGSLCF